MRAIGSFHFKIIRRPLRGRRGFTLVELLVVLAVIALASAGVVTALGDGRDAALERDAERLAALLESARAQSRASGVAVRWRSAGAGFVFEGLAPDALPRAWLSPDTRSAPDAQLLLGPEPLIGPQAVLLTAAGRPGRALRVATDGLRPFAVGAP